MLYSGGWQVCYCELALLHTYVGTVPGVMGCAAAGVAALVWLRSTLPPPVCREAKLSCRTYVHVQLYVHTYVHVRTVGVKKKCPYFSVVQGST